MKHRHDIDRAAPEALRLFEPDAPRDRLEELLGADMTRLLLSALAGSYRGRPDLRGTSSP